MRRFRFAAYVLLLPAGAFLISAARASTQTYTPASQGTGLGGPHALRYLTGGDAQSEFFYNANGDLTHSSGTSPSCQEYFVNRKLKRAASSEDCSNGIRYFYTTSGEKVAVRHPEGKTHVFSDGLRFTKKQEGDSFVPRFSYGDVETNEDGDHLNFFLKDHLGSVLATVTSNGTLERKDTLPFGESWYEQHLTEQTDYDFNGNQKEGHLLDYNARHYWPEIGKFTAADSIIPHQDSIAFNRYTYVRNNPVNRVDPTGNRDFLFDRASTLSVSFSTAEPLSTKAEEYLVRRTEEYYPAMYDTERGVRFVRSYFSTGRETLNFVWDEHAPGGNVGLFEDPIFDFVSLGAARPLSVLGRGADRALGRGFMRLTQRAGAGVDDLVPGFLDDVASAMQKEFSKELSQGGRIAVAGSFARGDARVGRSFYNLLPRSWQTRLPQKPHDLDLFVLMPKGTPLEETAAIWARGFELRLSLQGSLAKRYRRWIPEIDIGSVPNEGQFMRSIHTFRPAVENVDYRVLQPALQGSF